VIHGITGMAEHIERAAGLPARNPLLFVRQHGAYVRPLWIAVFVLGSMLSVVFVRAVARGDTALPRWMALANPVALIVLAALLGAPTPLGRAILVPAAPNVAHVWLFALAAIALGRTRSAAQRPESKRRFPA